MSADTAMAWLPQAPKDWPARCAALDRRVRDGALNERQSASDASVELRRLAGFDLDQGQRLRLQRLVARFASHAGAIPEFRRFRLGIVAARTLDYLAAALPSAAVARGILLECLLAPYDMLASYAFGDANAFPEATLDAVLIVPDATSFPNPGALLDEEGERERVAAAMDCISRSADATRRKAGCTAIVATVAEGACRIGTADRSVAGSASRFAMLLNLGILDGSRAGRWAVWDLAALAADIGHTRWFDALRYHQAKVPFAIELAPRVAMDLAAMLAATTGKSGRAIVLDLDNTIWGGEIGDDGIEGILVGPGSPDGEAFAAFQRFVLDLRARGIAIAACSKNDDAIAREPFRCHPGMVLREEHFAVFQANWLDKATNIRSIAQALHVGLECIVFVDDNPAERARVRQELPLVSVPEIGSDPAEFVRLLSASGALAQSPPTADDLTRAAAFGADARRARVRSVIGHYDDYLRSLHMRLAIAPFDDLGRARIVQLANKSNQFNLTTRRYNDEDVRRMTRDASLLCWQASLDDAFGTHGMIAVVIVRKAAAYWTIDTWLQSCRVLERGVEACLMDRLVATARAAGVAQLRGEYRRTDRNGMVADFYPRLGFHAVGTDSDGNALFVLQVNEWEAKPVFMEVQITASESA